MRAEIERHLAQSVMGDASVRGRVVDERAAPIAGAVVSFTNDHGGWNVRADTDAAGGYRFDGLPAGPLRIGADSLAYTYAETTLSLPEKGEVVAPDIVLRAGGAVAGRIVDEAGRPFPGGRVQASVNSLAPREVVSDAAGIYRFASLPGGEVRLEASAPGRVKPPSQRVAVAVGFEAIGPEFVLAAGAVVSGKVYAREGEPLGGATIAASRGVEVIAAATSGADGSYRIDGLPGGPIHLYVRSNDYAQATTRELALAAGREHPGIDFVLETASSIRGVVQDEKGAPIPNATITAESFPSGPVRRQAQSGADGTFEVRNLYGGGYRITAAAIGYAPAEPASVAVAGEGDQVEGVVLVLVGAATIPGRVTGLPPEGAGSRAYVIPTSESSNNVASEVAPDGTFRVEGLPRGPIILLFRTDDFRLLGRHDVLVEGSGEQPPVEIPAGPPARFTGRITNEDGSPVSGIEVASELVMPGASRARRSTRTDADGRYEIPNLYWGRYAVRVGAGVATREVEIATAGQVLDGVDFVLPLLK